jgi:hypothetical protein
MSVKVAKVTSATATARDFLSDMVSRSDISSRSREGHGEHEVPSCTGASS